MSSIPVHVLEQDKDHRLNLTLKAGRKGLQRQIAHPQAQKMGLALTGFTQFISPERLQIVGKAELAYLHTLSLESQKEVIKKICGLGVACVVVTRNLEVPKLLVDEADEQGIPVFQTDLSSTEFIDRVNKFLEVKLAATTSIHGVLMDVFGVGVLILGKSGIGKSECALDLILRGHRLVADDMVFMQKRSASFILGSGFDIIQHHMEIRGLGIINIRSLFGVEAIRERKKIELVVELLEWNADEDYDRLGFEEEKYPILEVDLPRLKIPVTPGRNLSTIIEVAARNHLLKMMGYDSALEFEKRLIHRMEMNGRGHLEVEDEVE